MKTARYVPGICHHNACSSSVQYRGSSLTAPNERLFAPFAASYVASLPRSSARTFGIERIDHLVGNVPKLEQTR
eukprot:2379295-Pleurochrysis_carterae.AAC.1